MSTLISNQRTMSEWTLRDVLATVCFIKGLYAISSKVELCTLVTLSVKNTLLTIYNFCLYDFNIKYDFYKTHRTYNIESMELKV